MKKQSFITAALLAGVLSLTGCATNPSNAQLGAGVGAVAGGVLGDAVFGSTLGTIGGAAAGAYFGHQEGDNMDGRRGRRY